MNYVPLLFLFFLLLPLFHYFSLSERWNALNAPDFEQKGRARYVFYWTHQILVKYIFFTLLCMSLSFSSIIWMNRNRQFKSLFYLFIYLLIFEKLAVIVIATLSVCLCEASSREKWHWNMYVENHMHIHNSTIINSIFFSKQGFGLESLLSCTSCVQVENGD